MRIINYPTSDFKTPTVIALGSFDALHIAHMQLVGYAVDYAKKNNISSGVYMFERRPETVLMPDDDNLCILSNDSKCDILDSAGVDIVCFSNFGDICNMSARDFVMMLKDNFDISCVVVGFHYRFGYKAEGDVELLKTLGDELGFEVKVFDPIMIDDRIVSSTYIRSLVAKGDMHRALRFLGRPFFLLGDVIADRGFGSQIGFPTANISVQNDMALPAFGVYATKVYIDGIEHNGVTNVGIRPTFSLDMPTVETHILEFDGDIYGECIKVDFIAKIRGEKKFNTLNELQVQIFSDIDKAELLLGV